jgi:hypothetical protein
VSVRIANEDDLPDLARLLLAFRDHLGTGRPTEEALLSFLPEVLADSTTEFCLAHSEAGDAVGFTQCRYFRSVWESGWKVQLEDLFVGREFHWVRAIDRR